MSASPPPVDAARQHLSNSLRQVEGKEVDLATLSWTDLEKGVVKLLKGPFNIESGEHQFLALGIAAVLGDRLTAEHKAFWFPNREVQEGFLMGFPDALIMLSPFGAVMDALRAAKLERLDDLVKEIRTGLAKVKFSVNPQAAQRALSAVDYVRLFDPGFVQFVAVDPERAKTVWDYTPEKAQREIADAMNRIAAKLPKEARADVEQQMTGALARLEAGKPMLAQAQRAPRVVEMVTHLFAAKQATGCAPEEFWQEVVFPLLHIGAPANFPPLDDEELELVKKGADPFLVYLDVVPHQHSAQDEGLLGAIATSEVSLVHDAFRGPGIPRILRVQPDRLKALLAAYDERQVRDAVARFAAYLKEKTGEERASSAEGQQLFTSALTLLNELKEVLSAPGELYLRHLTEAEAMSEATLSLVRDALAGPRIILV